MHLTIEDGRYIASCLQALVPRGKQSITGADATQLHAQPPVQPTDHPLTASLLPFKPESAALVQNTHPDDRGSARPWQM